MATLYHRAKDGTVKICKATKGNCPLNSEHFTDSTEAQKYADKLLEDEYGILNENKDLNTKENTKEAKPGDSSNRKNYKGNKDKNKKKGDTKWIDTIKEISLYEGTISKGKVSKHFQYDRKERHKAMDAHFGPGRPLKTFIVTTTDDMKTYYQVHDNGRTKIYGEDNTLITEFIPNRSRIAALYDGANTSVPPGLLEITDKNHTELEKYNKKEQKRKTAIQANLKIIKKKYPNWDKKKQWEAAEDQYKTSIKKKKKRAKNLAARKAKKEKTSGSSLDSLFSSINK